MSITAFQSVITLQSITDPDPGLGNWVFTFTMVDYEGQFTPYNIIVGDVIVLDTSAIESSTLTLYTITSITARSAHSATVVVQFDPINASTSPDLYGYDTTYPGLITRRTPNKQLVNLPSPQIQSLPDKFVSYLINYMSNDIIDNFSTGGTGVDQVLDNATPTPTTIGGIAAGTTFDNVKVETVLQNLLYPYQAPSFTAFSISGQTTPLEVGASVVGGSRSFTWGTSNSSNIAANTVTIRDATNSVVLATATANDNSEALTITPVAKTAAGSHVWRISATSTNAQTFSRDYTVTWQWRRFHGEQGNASLTSTEIQALRVSALSASFAGNYSFNAGGYKYIAYPTLFGTATSFKDQSTNLDVPFQPVQLTSIINSNGVATNYNIHRTTNVIGASMTIVVA